MMKSDSGGFSEGPGPERRGGVGARGLPVESGSRAR